MMQRTILATAAAAALLAACGDKAPDTASADSTAAAAAAPAAPATPVVYTITAKDFAYDAPDTITAGMVTLHLVNSGPSIHHIQLLKLDDGHTVAELEAGLKQMKPGSPPPPWMHEVAGPNTPMPGGEQSLTQELAAGNYAIICFIPGPDHVPHAMKGMVRALTVVPASGPSAPAPVADITVSMSDYAWDVSPAITAGKHIIKIENTATQAHEMLIAQLPPGKTPADLLKWVDNQVGPPPAKPMGGISGMLTGQTVYLPVDLEPGEYALMCFLPDSKDGKPHAVHGMMKQVTVK